RYLYARGFADLEEGRFEQAVTHFSEGFQPFYPNRAPQLLYGIALLKAGRVDEAVEEFERATWWIPISFPPMSLLTLADGLAWPIAAVKAHYWLGVAYEQLGRKNDAAGEYRTFLEIWKDADFPSPEMKDARSRLERL
ncbi:MAG: Anaphase-promoting complex, cyclosome, subunit 3, partial [Bacteroidetes bacterium]|nr:Anaphase-promoting complex, cyclosome, subunit 3 [Bacteroidota bacterium]